MKRILISAALAALLPVAALAQDVTAKDPFVFATAASAMAAGAYISLENAGAADTLVEARSDVAKKVELHESRMVDGVMKMEHVPALPIPEGGEVVMQPGGYHVMLMGLNHPLTEGETIAVTLVFESGLELPVEVPVVARPSGHGAGHGAMKMGD